MDMRSTMGVVVMGFVTSLLVMPSVWAADEQAVEAAQVSDATLTEIRQAIAAETDPVLKAAMEEQLRLLETGQLDLTTLGHEEKDLALGAPQLTGTVPSGTTPPEGLLGPPRDKPLPMPVVDIGGGPPIGGGDYLPPEARKELEELFKQGTGDPTSEQDRELREKAHEILEKYGIEPREMDHEGEWKEGEWQERGEGFERAYLEHMSPEAREQMERFYDHEVFEHEFLAPESSVEREIEFGAPSLEVERVFEAPVYEPQESQQYLESPH